MSSKRNPSKPGARGTTRQVEWVGGRFSMPIFVTEREQPFRPELVLWLELPEGVIVGSTVEDPQRPTPFARTLRDTMAKPLVGPPRRPTLVRVADPVLAAELTADLDPTIEVRVAPTPELDLVQEDMFSHLGERGDEVTYLEGGKIEPALVAELFRAAALLFRLAPWKTASDEPLRMDIADLGVEGACVSILGALGETFGLAVFPSLVAYEAFIDAGGRHADDPDGADDPESPVDLGTSVLWLTFERGAELSPAQRREIVKHGWEVASPESYPRLQHPERDGVCRPLTAHDIRVVSACARTVGTFVMRNARHFSGEAEEPVSESISGESSPTVRFTAPYEAFGAFEAVEADPLPPIQAAPKPSLPAAVVGGPAVARNAPCPCGSGKKYKKCHLPIDEASRRSSSPSTDSSTPTRWVLPRSADVPAGVGASRAIHELDARLAESLLRFARDRFPAEWHEITASWRRDPLAAQHRGPLSLYHSKIHGASAAEHFAAERGARLTARERGWLDAQRAAWLSVWEVVTLDRGRGMTVKDLLTNETREVLESSASRTLFERHAILGRVAEYEGIAVFAGMHPRPLEPRDAATVVLAARTRLRRKTAIPIDRLRDEAIVEYLTKRWEEAVADQDLRSSTPPQLFNTDGDELLLTVDHFDVDPAARSQVLARIAKIEEADETQTDGDEDVIPFVQAASAQAGGLETVLTGRVCVRDDKLRIETNSIRRADRLRARVEKACGDRIRFRTREHTDPTSPQVRERVRRTSASPMPPEAEALVRGAKERHYADWVDFPIPALGGLTPREAIRSRRGREAVDVMLKQMESLEARLPESQRFDVGKLRAALALPG